MAAPSFYVDSSTGLFTQLGKLVKLYKKAEDDLRTSTTGLNDVVKDVLGKFTGAGNQDEAVSELVPAWKMWREQQVERRTQIAQLVLTRLGVRDSLDYTMAVSADPDEVLYKLVLQMFIDSDSSIPLADRATVLSHTGSPTPTPPTAATAIGGSPGTILVTDVLDGVNSPGIVGGVRMMPHGKYRGVASRLAPPGETMRFRVTADAFQDGVAEGAEVISWEGRSASEIHTVTGEGAGLIGSFSPINSSGLIENGSFEDVENGTEPVGWDVSSTTYVQSVTGGTPYHGSRELLLAAPTSSPPASISASLVLPKEQFVANAGYCVSLAVKKEAAISGDFYIRVEGTSFSALYSCSNSGVETSYQIRSVFFNMPDPIPADLKLIIEHLTPGVGNRLHIDDVAIGPITYGAGIGVAAVRGSTPFLRGHRYTLTIPNYTPGLFQEFFRKVFGVQLPTSTSPGIADSLAT